MLDCAIIGGGPAGLTAGLYTTRGGLDSVTMFEKGMPGGQITMSSEIENYPGVTGHITGMDLMIPWPEQCQRFGLKHEMSEVTQVARREDGIFLILKSDGTKEESKSVIVCTGSTPKRAGFIGEDAFFRTRCKYLRNLRRIFLQEQRSSGCRRRRYGIGRGSLSGKNLYESLSDPSS